MRSKDGEGSAREQPPPVAYGDSPLWDGAFGMAIQFPAKVQSARARQRLPPRGSWQSRQALTEGVPSRENGIAERPQALRYPEIKI